MINTGYPRGSDKKSRVVRSNLLIIFTKKLQEENVFIPFPQEHKSPK